MRKIIKNGTFQKCIREDILDVNPLKVAQALKIGQDDQAAIQEKLTQSRLESLIHFTVSKFWINCNKKFLSTFLQQLKAELEKAWLMLDAANEKEQRGRETIETLKVEIDNLTKVNRLQGF